MGGIFERCSSLTELDLTDWDTSNVLDMSVMFYECSNLQTIFASDKFNTYLVSAVGGDSLNRSELFTSDTALR
jgi:surface protein